MDLDTLDPENSVLFLGAGFNAGATAINGRELPQGNPLLSELASLLGINPVGYDLQTITQEFVRDDGADLYNLLYDTFTVSQLTPSHHTILALPWRRIYTTNYDNAITFYDSKIPVFSFDEAKPRSLPRRCAIHLHGCIRNCTSSNVLSQLVLNEESYIRRTVETSPWFAEFERDVRYSSSTFLIGYGLADHHIAARLRTSHEGKSSTFFISRAPISNIFLNRAKRYGAASDMGVDGFATLCRTLARPVPLSDVHKLRSFRYIDPFSDRRTLHPVTTPEIFHLVAFGTFNQTRFISTYPSEDYIIGRKELVEQAVSDLRNSKSLLVHSRLGNGKTIFTSLIAQELIAANYKVFRWKAQSSAFEQELKLLSKIGRIVVIIDDYDEAFEVVERIAATVPEAKFIVTARSSQQAVRFHEIAERFPRPIKRMAIDTLSASDKTALFRLLDRGGLRYPELAKTISDASEMREVVLTLYNNAQVRTKIEEYLAPSLSRNAFKFIAIAAQLCAWVGASASNSFIARAANVDTEIELDRYKEVAADFLTFDDTGVGARSALFSEYMIAQIFDLHDVLSVTYALIAGAVRFKVERSYRKLVSGLMQVNALKRLLREKPDLEAGLNTLFEALARDIYVNLEPLFWLQFAILKIESGYYSEAEGHLETSYARAEESPGFATYQIDTQALRIALQIETDFSPVGPVKRLDKISKGLRDVRPMITDESHRFFAMNVLERVEPFVRKRERDIDRADAGALKPELQLLVAALHSLTPELQAQTGALIVADQLMRALRVLEGRVAG